MTKSCNLRAPAVRADLPVLLVDTLSAGNDYGVELPVALDPLVRLTVFTLRGTRLRSDQCRRLLAVFPEYGGPRSHFAKLLTECAATVRLVREVWRHRHGVVFVQFFRYTPFEFPVYLLLRPFIATLACTVHNVLPHEPRWWQRPLYACWYRLVDRAHVLSRGTASRLVGEFGMPPRKIVHAPHGNYERFRAEHPVADVRSIRQELGLTDDQVLVLQYGQLRDYKGADLLIDAAARMAQSRAVIHLAGGCAPDMQQRLRQQAAAAGLGERLQLRFGFVESARLAALIEAADLVVFPYRKIDQSGALMLAMTYGKAMLASDLPGFREYLQDGDLGALCDVHTPEVFAEALDRLVADPQARADLGRRARAAAETLFAWSTAADTLVRAFGEH